MLNIYMIFSRSGGAIEGAALVFAHTSREARSVGWNGIGSDLAGGEYTDLSANRLWNHTWLYEEANLEKLKKDQAHVIDDPRYCVSCNLWGQSPIGVDRLCEACREDE